MGSFAAGLPLCSGHGCDSQGGATPYPHNLALEVGVEQGLVGLLALLNLLGSAFIILKRDTEGVADGFPSLLPGLIFLFLITMFSGDIVDNRFLWFWCGLVFASLRIARIEPNEEEAPLEEWVEEPGHEGPAAALGEV
jgi:O-antigen ligase